jgi:CubicO group peptidase (beta-lactamase class C family)
MTTAFRQATLRLDDDLEGLVARGIVPGGVAVVMTAEGVVHERAFGLRAVVPAPESATPETLWDAASVTKALVVGLLFLRLRSRGAVGFEQPITEIVPEMGEGGSASCRVPTIGELLLHAGGLPAWKPLYAVAPPGLPARAAWLAGNRGEPGRDIVYGCPGYQVLGLAAGRASGQSLGELAARELWPGGEDLHFGLPDALHGRAAPTEMGNAFERGIAGEDAAAHRGWRDGLIRGDVHDHNAFTVGGAAGNAGLFGTGAAIARLAARLLVPDDLLSAADLGELSCDQAPELPGERRTWGFQLASSPGSAAGPALSARCFGHVGFTGTSVFVDPDRRAVYVLMTNRIHPRHVEHPFNADRRAFHEAAARVAEAGRG